jgi:Trk K+ transport system NAD-binding subunit
LLEVRVQTDSPALGKKIGEVHWPSGSAVVAVTHGREVHAAAPELRLQSGERVLILMPLREAAEIKPNGDGG